MPRRFSSRAVVPTTPPASSAQVTIIDAFEAVGSILKNPDYVNAGFGDVKMLLQVHDELVVEVAEGEREQAEKVVREEMGNAIDLSVPLEVSVGFGRSWDDAAH